MTNLYWQHFLALEADFAATARYVDFSEANFNTYSVEYTKLLLAVASEVDVLCKMICESIDPLARRKDIVDYRKCIKSRCQITSEKVFIRRYNLEFQPWLSWDSDKSPSWWTSYNDVKHKRNIHSNKANLGNCAHAIAGLFVIVLYYYKKVEGNTNLNPYPTLLGREQEPYYLVTASGYDVSDFT